ncbi:uncharacterized protein DFL_004245 [Arthrobotrys flagrans]|uniref:Dienelactone hydrolase domain-containing protein n=1 Tax=Arthrobotrys flagrans TaxID=97331 RepID=A0A437A471_ARTFL|nr:hypothetical protein DFL_004245 [Arthrobotrys flagrans]
MTSIVISRAPYQLSGRLYAPEAPTTNYSPAIIVVPPSNAVKEQFPSTYARLLSRRPHNFYTICYDPSHFGASGGNPRYLEDPNARVADISTIVDYLMREVRRVDKQKIGVMGICMGGGYAIAAAKKDWRIKAVATVNLVNIGDWFRIGWEGRESVEKHTETMKTVGDERRKELRMRPSSSSSGLSGISLGPSVISLPSTPVDTRRSVTPTFDSYRRPSTPTSPGFREPYTGAEEEMGKLVLFIPATNEKSHVDLQELTEYYTTPRAFHPRAENILLQQSLPLILTFDAFDFVGTFLKAPVFCMIGGTAGSRWHTDRLDIMLRRGSQSGIRGVNKLVFVEGVGHVDFFDGFEEIDRAVGDIGAWMREKLTGP